MYYVVQESYYNFSVILLSTDKKEDDETQFIMGCRKSIL